MNAKEWLENTHKEWDAEIKRRDLLRCSVCGYNKCSGAIELHHKEPSQKEGTISKMRHLKPTPSRLSELDKVIAVCANCHRELHFHV